MYSVRGRSLVELGSNIVRSKAINAPVNSTKYSVRSVLLELHGRQGWTLPSIIRWESVENLRSKRG